MHTIEELLQKALAKIDSKDRAQRQQVYKLAWRAYEKAILAKKPLNQEQRQALYTTFVAATKRVEERVSSLEKTPPMQMSATRDNRHPPLETQEEDKLQRASKSKRVSFMKSHGVSQGDSLDAPQKTPSAKPTTSKNSSVCPRRSNHWRAEGYTKYRPWRWLFIAWLVLGLGASWSLYRTIFQGVDSKTKHQGANHPPATVDKIVTGNSLLYNRNNTMRWQKVFDPEMTQSLHLLHTRGPAHIEKQKDNSTVYAHIRLTGTEGGVGIPLTKTLVDQFRGKRVLFDMIVQKEQHVPADLKVLCDFGNGKHSETVHFEAPSYIDNLLFEVVFPEDASYDTRLYLTAQSQANPLAFNIFSVLATPSASEVP